MSDNLDTNPILIDPSSTVGQLGALLRYVLTAGGGFALGRGWISSDALQFLTGLLTVILPTAYGIWKTHQTKQKLVEVAAAAPDSVAVVKGAGDA
jgi:hypothetical protein